MAMEKSEADEAAPLISDDLVRRFALLIFAVFGGLSLTLVGALIAGWDVPALRIGLFLAALVTLLPPVIEYLFK